MMRFGISNLVFGQLSDACRDAVLSVSQICDFAPTVHYGSWDNTPAVLPLHPYTGHETGICAVQSLFFGVQGASLLKDDAHFDVLIAHHERLVRWAGEARIPCLIFGSPGTRAGRFVELTDAQLLARVRRLADVAAARGVKLCFEVNSPKFGCEYLSTNIALLSLLDELRHPGLGLHLDVGQMVEEGLDVLTFVASNARNLLHLHLSAPDFTCVPSMLPLYKDVIAILRQGLPQPDVVLEVQKLGAAGEADLIDMCQQLEAECRA